MPGMIHVNPLGEKRFSATEKSTMTEDEAKRGLTRVISVEKERVDGENCGGPVAIRLEARASMKTIDSDSYLTAYSDIVAL